MIEGTNRRDQIASCAFHSSLVEVSIVVNLVPGVFSLSNVAGAEEDPGTRLYSGRYYPCPLNKGNAGSKERGWMQAFLSPEPLVSWSRGLETSGSGDENGM